MHTVESIKNLFLQFGPGWVLWLLFGLSIVSVAIAIERLVFFRAKGDDIHGLAATLDAHLKVGDYAGAIAVLAPQTGVGAAIAAAGLRLADRGAAAVEKGMESALRLERKRLEARLAYLGTLGNNAPFVGLLGTVIGIILAFEELGRAGGASAGATGGAASQAVMSAIAEALVATAVGIAVALPAVAFYNYLQRRVMSMVADAEALMSLVLAYLVAEDEPAAAKATKSAKKEAA
jgi:biopolymer transport protein ExbB